MDREIEPMSETAILPLVDVVKKEWKKDNVITFLQKEDLNLDLDDEDIDIIRSKKVSGKDFLGLTAEKLENYGLQPGPASRIAELVKEIKGEQEQPGASGLSREPTGLVHVFIDNSNVEIEGKKFVSSLQAVCENQLHMDHGRLLGLVLDGRQLGEDPVVVGSRPPPNDSLWKEIENLGFMVKVYDRNCRDKEKEVDSELGAFISDAIQEHRRPGIVALIAGDGDHCPFLRRALLRGWSVEVWFWTEGMSSRLMKINVPDRPDLQTTIINLDPYYSHFIYAYGRENTWRKEFLEIEDSVGTWDSESMMECYEELNLFCWWSYKPRNTFYMYFDEYEQWKEAKNWILEKYSDITEYRKEMAQLNPRQMPCQIVLQIDKR